MHIQEPSQDQMPILDVDLVPSTTLGLAAVEQSLGFSIATTDLQATTTMTTVTTVMMLE